MCMQLTELHRVLQGADWAGSPVTNYLQIYGLYPAYLHRISSYFSIESVIHKTEILHLVTSVVMDSQVRPNIKASLDRISDSKLGNFGQK